MFDNSMIVGKEFKNVVESGEVTGFQIGMRLPYYRGIVLSLIGDTKLTVDGETYTPEQMSITINGKTLPHTELENDPVTKWEFGEIGILTINKPGGLEPGEHTVGLYQHLKISYVPVGFSGEYEEVLQLAS